MDRRGFTFPNEVAWSSVVGKATWCPWEPWVLAGISQCSGSALNCQQASHTHTTEGSLSLILLLALALNPKQAHGGRGMLVTWLRPLREWVFFQQY